MRILVTGSRGHLGEALMRALPSLGHEVVGLARPSTTPRRTLMRVVLVWQAIDQASAGRGGSPLEEEGPWSRYASPSRSA